MYEQSEIIGLIVWDSHDGLPTEYLFVVWAWLIPDTPKNRSDINACLSRLFSHSELLVGKYLAAGRNVFSLPIASFRSLFEHLFYLEKSLISFEEVSVDSSRSFPFNYRALPFP